MKLTHELTITISAELSKPLNEEKLKEFDKLMSDMKKIGLIKKPVYTLPLVDTIGKTYYSSINKHK